MNAYEPGSAYELTCYGNDEKGPITDENKQKQKHQKKKGNKTRR